MLPEAPPESPSPGPLPTRIGFLSLVVVGIVAVGMAVAFLTRGTDQPTPPAPSVIGGPAPDFQIELFDGSTFSLFEHLATDGRPVVLNLWASWCAPCRTEMPELDAFARQNPDVLVLGIAVEDTASEARAFAEEIGVTYPLGIDEGTTISTAYPFFGLPVTYLIDGNGTVASRLNGAVTADHLQVVLQQSLGG